MLKIYILVVVLGLVGGVIYGAYYYYKTHKHELQYSQRTVQN